MRRRALLFRNKCALVGLSARNVRGHFSVAARAYIFDLVDPIAPPARGAARYATRRIGYCRGPGRQPGCICRTRRRRRDMRRWTWRWRRG